MEQKLVDFSVLFLLLEQLITEKSRKYGQPRERGELNLIKKFRFRSIITFILMASDVYIFS